MEVAVTEKPAISAILHRHYRWELLALLFLAFFFHQADRALFGVVLSSIRVELQLSDQQLGLVGSVLFFTLAIMMPLAGYVGDIASRKKIIICSVFFWSVATMLTGMAHGLIGLIFFRSIATAGGESFYAPAAYPLLASFHKKTRSLALSVHQSSLYLGVMVSGFLGGYIAERWGWRSAFYVFGGFGVLLGLVLASRLQDTPAERVERQPAGTRTSPFEALGMLFRTPTALLLTVGFAAIVFVNNAYVVWAPEFIKEKFGLSLTDAGGYSMFYHHLAALAGVLFGGKVSDALAATRPGIRIQLQSAAMLLGAPAILLLGISSTLTWTYIAMAAFGLFRGLYEANTHASLFEVIPPRYRASAVGMMVMLAFLAGSVSPWMLGKFRDTYGSHGLSYGFAALSGAYVIGGLAVLAAAVLTFRKDRCIEDAQ